MFDIGWTELLVIAIVAILIVGPKDLPRMLRTVGNYAGKVRRMADEFRKQFDDAIRDSELDEIRQSMESVRDIDPLKDIRSSVDETMAPLEKTGDDAKRAAEKPVPATAGEPVETEKTDKPAAKPRTKPAPEKAAGNGAGAPSRGAGSES